MTPAPASAPPSRRSCPRPPGNVSSPRFARNIISKLGSARFKPADALVSTIFAQTSQETIATQYERVINSLKDSLPFRIADMLADVQSDLTVFATFPRENLAEDPDAATPPNGSSTAPDLFCSNSTRNGSTANNDTCHRPYCSA